MNYVKNEDDSIDFIVSIRKDRDNNSGCDECDLKKKCMSKKFKKAKCLIEELFGIKNDDYHIEIIT